MYTMYTYLDINIDVHGHERFNLKTRFLVCSLKTKWKLFTWGKWGFKLKSFSAPQCKLEAKFRDSESPEIKIYSVLMKKSKIYIRWLKNKKSTRWQRLFSKVHKVCNQRINSAYQWFFALARLSIYEFWNFSSQII